MTTAFGAALLRETEIVPAAGDSKDASSVPACVTIVAGTTMFSTPPESVVHADAAGARARAASSAGADGGKTHARTLPAPQRRRNTDHIVL